MAQGPSFRSISRRRKENILEGDQQGAPLLIYTANHPLPSAVEQDDPPSAQGRSQTGSFIHRDTRRRHGLKLQKIIHLLTLEWA